MSGITQQPGRQCGAGQQAGTRMPRYRRTDDLAWVGGSRVVVLDLSRPDAAPIALEGSAAWMWDQLAEDTSAAALAYHAAHEFDADVEDLIDDVRSFLDQLTASGLLQRSGGVQPSGPQ